jgi:hypothetical protein
MFQPSAKLLLRLLAIPARQQATHAPWRQVRNLDMKLPIVNPDTASLAGLFIDCQTQFHTHKKVFLTTRPGEHF